MGDASDTEEDVKKIMKLMLIIKWSNKIKAVNLQFWAKQKLKEMKETQKIKTTNAMSVNSGWNVTTELLWSYK